MSDPVMIKIAVDEANSMLIAMAMMAQALSPSHREAFEVVVESCGAKLDIVTKQVEKEAAYEVEKIRREVGE